MTELRTLRSVLVVEDHPDHRALAERALRRAGLEVRTATSGEDALEKVNGTDLVLVDYGLPKMNGLEVLEAIRARRGPPVVLVTGMGSEAIAVGALKGGAIDYIVKTPGYLTSLPEAVLRAWRAHDLAERAAELQRLTLLVAAASDRGEVLFEIARGARALLGTAACGVFVAAAAGWTLEAFDGDPDTKSELLGFNPDGGVPIPTGPAEETTRLLVPLPGPGESEQGVLVFVTTESRIYVPQEIELARTFASFAGMALMNMARLELERKLQSGLMERCLRRLHERAPAIRTVEAE